MQDKIKGITDRQFAAMVVLMLLIAISSIAIFEYRAERKHNHIKSDSVDFKLMQNFIHRNLIKKGIKKVESEVKVLTVKDTIYLERWHKAIEHSQSAPDTCYEYISRLIYACDTMRNNLVALNKKLREADSLKTLSAEIDSSDIAMLYTKKNEADSTIFSLKAELAKAISQKKKWRNATLIQAGYIILREGKSILLN